VIEGEKVNLVSPFPEANICDMHRWMRTAMIAQTDDCPQDPAEFEARTREVLAGLQSWGVIDKTDGAVIGVVLIEPVGMLGAKSYIASARRAWGKGLMDEAARMVMKEVFGSGATHIQGWVLENNAPSKAFSKRIGMRLKNILPGHTMQGGRLRDVHVYEVTRWD
jgi:RimJ/RimL family protein N-acetyltransferase